MPFDQMAQYLAMDARRESSPENGELIPYFHALQPFVFVGSVMGRYRLPVDGDLPSAYLPDHSERFVLHDSPDPGIQRQLVATLPSVQFPVNDHQRLLGNVICPR